MDRKTLVMLLLREAKEQGKWIGRTFLQKTIFFINKKHNLGIDYKPHYFGPYSDQLASSVKSAVAIGLVSEKYEPLAILNEQPFEAIRYEYDLTAEGKKVLEDNLKNIEKEKLEDILKTVKKVLDSGADYQSLSVAAKTYHILEKKKIETAEQVKKEAKKLGWNLKPEAIQKGANLLMDLIDNNQ